MSSAQSRDSKNSTCINVYVCVSTGASSTPDGVSPRIQSQITRLYESNIKRLSLVGSWPSTPNY